MVFPFAAWLGIGRGSGTESGLAGAAAEEEEEAPAEEENEEEEVSSVSTFSRICFCTLRRMVRSRALAFRFTQELQWGMISSSSRVSRSVSEEKRPCKAGDWISPATRSERTFSNCRASRSPVKIALTELVGAVMGLSMPSRWGVETVGEARGPLEIEEMPGD